MAFRRSELEVFIGTGITLPLRLVGGKAVLESGTELIRSSIKMILAWTYGTRFFLNEFGSRLEDLLEDPTDDLMLQLIEDITQSALETWEKRIEVGEIEVQRSDRELGRIDINITYRVKSTERVDTFIYPFYYQIA